MEQLTHFTDTTPDLTDGEKELLRTAGASEALIVLCETETDLDRHSALQETKKYLREWENLTEEKVDEFSHLGGSFYSQMWDGNLYKAFSMADANNSEIMLDAFSVREINRDRPTYADKVGV